MTGSTKGTIQLLCEANDITGEFFDVGNEAYTLLKEHNPWLLAAYGDLSTVAWEDNMNHDTVMMPKELTAENGAKAVLSGEFKETFAVPCRDCLDESGWEDCPTCGGTGEVWQDVPISWTIIKEIYAKAVECVGVLDHE